MLKILLKRKDLMLFSRHIPEGNTVEIYEKMDEEYSFI